MPTATSMGVPSVSMISTTGIPAANYVASNGLARRGDLGGLRLADVPAVFIETGNMRNPAEARRMTRPAFRLKVARGIVRGIQRFLGRS